MRRLFVVFSVLSIFLSSCGEKFVENEDEKYLEENIQQIRNYLAQNNITLTEDDSGIFYGKTVENPDGKAPGLDLTIHVAYKITSLSGAELFNITAEDSSFFSYSSSVVFQGFAIAISSLKEGEKGLFYIPSGYAFGGNPPSNLNLKPWEVIVIEMEIIKIYDEEGLIDLFVEKQNLGSSFNTDIGVRMFRVSPRPDTKDLEPGDLVTLKYKGFLLDAAKTLFDQGEFQYTIGSGGVITGFDNALDNMRVGEKATALIPSLHAYGTRGSSDGAIPPNSPIGFELEIVSLDN